MTRPGVVDLAAAVAAGVRTAVEIITEHLERSESAQPALNAYTLLDTERALAAAATIDRKIAAREPVGPLGGVPIAVKDIIDHAGRPTTCGSGFPPIVPEHTAPAVRLLEKAGAVIIGRTGLHEFAYGVTSENPWFGPVHNPWNLDLSPGGSSGGSGAAVAAGLAAGALGTDTAGSIRVPAALCGIVGLKVTHGRGSLRGVFPLAPSLDTVGPLARSVADTSALYTVIAEHDPADPWSVPRPLIAPSGVAFLDAITLGIPHPWVDSPQTDRVADGFRQGRRRLATAGVKLVDIDVPELEPPGMIGPSASFEIAEVHRSRWQEAPERYGSDTARRLATTFETTGSDYLEALRWRARCRHAADRALQQCDALLTPTVAALEKPIGVDTIPIRGEHVQHWGLLTTFTALVSHISLPALALPQVVAGAPPPSLQLIGPPWSEHRLLEIGAALESAGIVGAEVPTGTVEAG